MLIRWAHVGWEIGLCMDGCRSELCPPIHWCRHTRGEGKEKGGGREGREREGGEAGGRKEGKNDIE